MDLKRKIEVATLALESIATHTDADSVVRLAALDALVTSVDHAKASIARESAREVAALAETPSN